ncbi:MAG: sigma-70 family RNA polymerase sigma factor [Anaerolineae bacterium]|nr:sigma-70 family RNA polymerase sigma factor [Anaerolineae bacterium]
MPDQEESPRLTQRTNAEWLADLRAPGPARDQAIADLRATLLRGLRYALSSRATVREADLEDFVQEALLRVLNDLDSFRGEARLTTWAQKIAVRVAFSELRRRRWRDVSLETMTETPTGGGVHPACAGRPCARLGAAGRAQAGHRGHAPRHRRGADGAAAPGARRCGA